MCCIDFSLLFLLNYYKDTFLLQKSNLLLDDNRYYQNSSVTVGNSYLVNESTGL
jgi:hypothetical protein